MADPQDCDLLIEAGWVVPVEPHGVVLEGHGVAVRDGAIVALLPIAEARASFRPAQVVSRRRPPTGATVSARASACR